MYLYSYETIKEQYLDPSSKNRTSKILANEYRPISELKKSFKQLVDIINPIIKPYYSPFIGLKIEPYIADSRFGDSLCSFWYCMRLLGNVDPHYKFNKSEEYAYIGNPSYFVSSYYFLKRLYESTAENQYTVKSELEICLNKAQEYYNNYFRYIHLSELYKAFYQHDSTSTSYLEFWTERLIKDETMLKKEGLFHKFQESFDKIIFEYNKLNFEKLITLYKLFVEEYYNDTKDEEFLFDSNKFIYLTQYFIYPELTEEPEFQKYNVLVKFVKDYRCKEMEKILFSHFTNLRWIYNLQNMEETIYLLHKELLKSSGETIVKKVHTLFNRENEFMDALCNRCFVMPSINFYSRTKVLFDKINTSKSVIKIIEKRKKAKPDFNLKYCTQCLDTICCFYYFEPTYFKPTDTIISIIDKYQTYVSENDTKENSEVLMELIDAYDNFDYETILVNLEKIYPIRLDDSEIERLIDRMKYRYRYYQLIF